MLRLIPIVIASLSVPLLAHEGSHLGHDPLSQSILDHGFGLFAVLLAGLGLVAWRLRRRAR